MLRRPTQPLHLSEHTADPYLRRPVLTACVGQAPHQWWYRRLVFTAGTGHASVVVQETYPYSWDRPRISGSTGDLSSQLGQATHQWLPETCPHRWDRPRISGYRRLVLTDGTGHASVVTGDLSSQMGQATHQWWYRRLVLTAGTGHASVVVPETCPHGMCGTGHASVVAPETCPHSSDRPLHVWDSPRISGATGDLSSQQVWDRLRISNGI
ncbi:hypothetical protein NDU88_000699 [Pleurodeles waltl]|uniref:Uncharacterized protein n=1 Tax=Pleurodeles waltl TaxID=8319 RepID=A0AAV7U4A2_PLEWA|nr:hypothetical protein NDU88_000699 [Pleurodeles waltl]